MSDPIDTLLETIERLHRSEDGRCVTCARDDANFALPWPCPTIAAVNTYRAAVSPHEDGPAHTCRAGVIGSAYGCPACGLGPRSVVASVGSRGEGYPCPKDGAVLTLIDAIPGKRAAGAWCPTCHTVWREVDEVPDPSPSPQEDKSAEPEWRCSSCQSSRWVRASLTGPVSLGGRAIRQCVPCGRYDPTPEDDPAPPLPQEQQSGGKGGDRG